MSDRLTIAADLLGSMPDMPGGYAPCPGKAAHSKGNGKRDFRVVLDGAPTGFCFHSSCAAEVEAFNKELRRRIWVLEHGTSGMPAEPFGRGVAAAPRRETVKRPPVDMAKLQVLAESGPRQVDEGWLRRRSPLDPRTVSSGQFLEALFPADERILVFTRQYSQGDFLWWSGRGSYRLSQERGTKAVASALPERGPEGVWFLVQPVTGQWLVAGSKFTSEEQPARWSRRSEGNVTSWRHFVIESDEVDAALWLRVLVQVPLPIAAIYTSGGRSIHALVRIETASKAQWDATRDLIRQLVCPLGADPAALTAVRLSRLPGCRRGDREQRLLYLCPEPAARAMMLLPEVREA